MNSFDSTCFVVPCVGDVRLPSVAKLVCNAAGLEYIPNRNDKGICIRPMHFDENGAPVVRYYPDKCDFMPYAKACRIVRRLAKVDRVWRTVRAWRMASSDAGWED